MLEKFHAFQIAKEFYWKCKDLELVRLADQLGAMLFTLSRKKMPTENPTDANAAADAD
jgi:hypothetical protein